MEADVLDAEVHGIDVNGPQVCSAHASAEGLGEVIRYSEQCACATDSPEGRFHIACSLLLSYEMLAPVNSAR